MPGNRTAAFAQPRRPSRREISSAWCASRRLSKTADRFVARVPLASASRGAPGLSYIAVAAVMRVAPRERSMRRIPTVGLTARPSRRRSRTHRNRRLGPLRTRRGYASLNEWMRPRLTLPTASGRPWPRSPESRSRCWNGTISMKSSLRGCGPFGILRWTRCEPTARMLAQKLGRRGSALAGLGRTGRET